MFPLAPSQIILTTDFTALWRRTEADLVYLNTTKSLFLVPTKKSIISANGTDIAISTKNIFI